MSNLIVERISYSCGARVTGVDVTYRDGRVEHITCDTVVLTGDMVPEYEVAMRSGLLIDSATKGPAVDATARTSRTGVRSRMRSRKGATSAST